MTEIDCFILIRSLRGESLVLVQCSGFHTGINHEMSLQNINKRNEMQAR